MSEIREWRGGPGDLIRRKPRKFRALSQASTEGVGIRPSSVVRPASTLYRNRNRSLQGRVGISTKEQIGPVEVDELMECPPLVFFLFVSQKLFRSSNGLIREQV